MRYHLTIADRRGHERLRRGHFKRERRQPWEDWFAVAGRPDTAPRRVGFDSYSYMLEAAAAGHGIALGWRYFMDRQLEAGALVALGDGFHETGNLYFAVLTEKGRRKPIAR